MTTVRYWAGVLAGAGPTTEQVEAVDLAEALAELRRRHGERLSAVLEVCAFLVDGRPVGTRDPAAVPLADAELVDVLPPFAGG
jgi:sulfur-carrier protein